MLADRINNIGVSQTMRIAAKALEMKAGGIDLVDFSVGEPDFPTPDNINEAAKRAIDSGFTKYTVNPGHPELRKAIAGKLKRENQLDYKPGEIIVSNGAKQALYNVVFALIDSGDEVVMALPYWPSHPEMVKLAGGIPVMVNTKLENGFRITPEELEASITPSTKAFVLCNPANPTGALYSNEELKALSDVIQKHNLFVIADEIYEKLSYDIPFVSFAAVNEEMKKRTVIINGMSKSYAMTGWRLGYAAGPEEIINAAARIQSHSTSNASTISQYAGLEALKGSQEEIVKMVDEFRRRRDYIFERISRIPGIVLEKPAGAFYLFPDVSAFNGKSFNGRNINSSFDLADYLLTEAKIAVIPGEGFGLEGYLRISYSTSMERIETGMDRMAEALGKLK